MKRKERQSDFFLSIFHHPLSVRAPRECSQVTHIALLSTGRSLRWGIVANILITEKTKNRIESEKQKYHSNLKFGARRRMALSGLSVDSFSEQPSGISFNLFQKDNSYHRPDENLVRDMWSQERIKRNCSVTRGW